MDKCCGTCVHKYGVGNGWVKCLAPLPFWAMARKSDETHSQYDGGDCDTYEPKITLDKPHRPT